MPTEPKEIDVFKKYSKNNKFIIVVIALLLASVIVTALFFFIKTLLTYTVKFELNGGYVYGVTDTTLELGFLERVYTPKVKKVGYYLEEWCKDEELTEKFTEGSRIWSNMTLYAHWEEGFAVRLNYAEGEENSDLPISNLKGLYEDYVKPGSSWTLPLIYNTNKNSLHYGEQLLWYDNPECTGDPFQTGSYIVTKNTDIYGKWYDTKKEKFEIDESGVLINYKGYCRHIILPETVKKIRGIKYENFKQGFSDQQFGKENHSVFQNVLGVDSSANSLNIIYLNKELTEIGECAFRSCTALKKVVFLGDNTKLGDYAFDGCTSLKEISLPSGISKISKGCFKGAFNKDDQVTLNLGSNITAIEDDAFINSALYSITLNNVSFIGQSAFSSCHELIKVYLNYDEVITTNCNPSDVTSNVFYDTHTNHELSQHLIIIVPESLLDAYKTTYPWNLYSNTIITE